MKILKLSWLLSTLCLSLAACTEDPAEQTVSTVAPGAQIQALILADDPGQAVGVMAAKQAGPDESVLVEGRVQQMTAGFAMLKLTDSSLPYCGQEEPEDKCKTPWDYCCESKDDRAAASLLVEFRGADGRPLSTPTLPETRLCDLLKVRGELVTDEHGNSVLVAQAMYRVERPELPDYVRWPTGN